MQRRELGTTGVSVSPIAFGAMRITADSDGTSPVLLHALERGVSIIDTARNYGESEAIVGRTLRQWRGPRPFLATKVKPRDVTNWRFYVPMPEQFTRASIIESAETSLRTLGVDCIDLLQIHQWYYRWSHESEWLEALHALRDAGKIRFIGVSAQDHEHDGVLKVVDDRMVDSVQVVLNAFESRPFVSVVPLAEARGVGVIARCLFDHSGALAGAATASIPGAGREARERLTRNRHGVPASHRSPSRRSGSACDDARGIVGALRPVASRRLDDRGLVGHTSAGG